MATPSKELPKAPPAEKVPAYLQHCQAKGCDEPGHVYDDMLFPINLCSQHAHMRRDKRNR